MTLPDGQSIAIPEAWGVRGFSFANTLKKTLTFLLLVLRVNNSQYFGSFQYSTLTKEIILI